MTGANCDLGIELGPAFLDDLAQFLASSFGHDAQ
jgi:hypothetical protein